MSIFFTKLRWLKALAIATFATIVTIAPGFSADRIIAHYPPFKDFSISVRDLEEFAKDGTIPNEYKVLATQTPPEKLHQLQQLLQRRFEISPVYLSQLTNAPLVEKVLERIGESIQTDSRSNGMKSLRSALINAAKDKKQGLTAINVLRRFPGREINLDLSELFSIYDNFSEFFKRRDSTIATIDRLANAEAENAPIDFSTQLDLRQAGTVGWQKRQFAWRDGLRRRMVQGDLYLPQTTATNPVPVIVISHGVAEDRRTYAYLGEHLASYGFGVAVLQHVGGDTTHLQKYFSGMALPPMSTELLDRPRDVSFLLDELQRRAKSDSSLRKLDLQHVGLIGHSLGGYTVLALAGAEIDFARVKRDCNPNRSLNLSVLLQCGANELKPQAYALKDPRIQAIFAISPLDSTIFGKRGISQIRVPVFLMGGSNDIVTPAVPEQIYPFTWLETPNKYLAIIIEGTHFSTETISTSDAVFPAADGLIGPDPEQARIYARALSLAFFQTHLANRNEFQIYLNAAYGKFIKPTPTTVKSRVSLGLNLVSASAAESIALALEQDTSRAPKLAP